MLGMSEWFWLQVSVICAGLLKSYLNSAGKKPQTSVLLLEEETVCTPTIFCSEMRSCEFNSEYIFYILMFVICSYLLSSFNNNQAYSLYP